MKMKYKHFTQEEKDHIVDLYVIENMSSQKIADLLRRSRAGIIKVLKKEKIKINSVGAQLGHSISDLTKIKIGEANSGREFSQEQKIRMSNARRIGESPKLYLQQGYLAYKMLGKSILLHRKIWEITHNKIIPNGFVIHHIDGNRINNHANNLKLMSRSEHSKLHVEQGDFSIGVKNGY